MAYTYPKSKVNIDVSLVVKELTIQTEQLFQSLSLEIDRLIANGSTARQAEATILAQIQNEEGVYKTFVNSSKRKINHLQKTLVARPINNFARENTEQKFQWELGAVKTSHCSDCLRLSNMSPRTIQEWLAEGHSLPRDGQTECSVGCRCILRPV